MLLGAAALEAHQLRALNDPDIWWHLRTGVWILQHHSAPHTGLFSQYADLPWMATSWGFSLLAALVQSVLGLRAVPFLLMAGRCALAACAWLLARGQSHRFWLAVVLSVAAQGAVADLPPGPVICSIVLFTVELLLLFKVRRTGSARLLWVLPFLFVVWVNLHLEFTHGLAVLLLFGLAVAAENFFPRTSSELPEAGRLRFGGVSAAVAASFAATLLNPYFYHPWSAAYSSLTNFYFLDLSAATQSLRFRQLQDYVLLLLAMAAFFALGRRRSRDLFQLALLVLSAGMAFRFARDAWFLALSAVAILGNAAAGSAAEPDAGPSAQRAWRNETRVTLAALALAFTLILGWLMRRDQQYLLNRAAEAFPVRACDFIRQQHPPGAIFNDYLWGGFLTWYLPEYPVAMDDRNDLYGEEITSRYGRVMQGQLSLDADPSAGRASIFLLDKRSGMALALSRRADFRVIYKDDLAWILLRVR